jgi:cobalamin-dependent methionine synthase I
MSAAEGYAAQETALKEIECFLDELQDEAKSSLAPGERLMPRKSPGYGAMALSENDEIIEILDATRRIGVSATRAHQLAPSKSVTAVCEII